MTILKPGQGRLRVDDEPSESTVDNKQFKGLREVLAAIKAQSKTYRPKKPEPNPNPKTN